MRIGILNFRGQLGQGIRTGAFISVLDRSRFRVQDISFPPQSKLKKLKTTLFYPGELFSLKSSCVKKTEIFARHTAGMLDRIMDDSRIDLLQAETTLAAYVWLKSKRRCPCILDMHGLSYEQQIRQGFLKTEDEQSYWKKLQKDVITECDHIFAVSSNMADYLADYVDRDKITVVRNAGEVLPYRASYSRPLKTVYAGVFEYWEKVEDFISMSNHANGVRYFMMGDGRLKTKILEMEGKVQYLGSFDREGALKKMADFQIGIATSIDDITREVASPIKVFDYMSVGLPVICPDVGEWSQIVRDHKCGIVLSENKPVRFVEALKSIDSRSWEEMSDNCGRLIKEEYNWNNVIKKYAFPVYERLANQ